MPSAHSGHGCNTTTQMAQRVDPKILANISEMTRDGCTDAREIKRRIAKFVDLDTDNGNVSETSTTR